MMKKVDKHKSASQNATATACAWPHRDRASFCRNIAISLLVPATLAVAARVISRLPQYNGPLGPDDYIILLVWVSPSLVQKSAADVIKATFGRFHRLDLCQYVFDEHHPSL